MRWLLVLALVIVCVGGISRQAAHKIYAERKLRALEPKQLSSFVEWSGPSRASCDLLLIGDSRVARWPLDPSSGWRFGRLGFPGEAAVNIGPSSRRHLRQEAPAAVVVQAGINDATAAAMQNEQERHRTVERAARALIELGRQARRAGTREVILTTIVPPIELELWKRVVIGKDYADVVARLNERVRHAAAEADFRLLDADALLRDDHGRLREDYRDDSIHWSPAAYRRLNASLDEMLPPC